MGNGKFVEVIMRLTNEIILHVVQSASEFKQSECDVVHNNKITGVRVAGKILEASVKISDNLYMLFTTDGIVFEESLNIFLIQLGNKSQIIDSATVGAMYSTGIFEELIISSDDSLSFRFIGDNLWKVTVYPTPRFRIPYIKENKMISRPVGFKRYFSVTESEIN